MRYAHIVRWFASAVWAILPEKLEVMDDALMFLANGGEYTAEEVQRIVGARPRESSRVKGSVAVLPLYGVLSQRANLVTEASGGTSTEIFGADLRALMADPSIGSVVLDVDSPGGDVQGIEELSSEIYRARGQKPIVAVANSVAASAAYWVATAADELVMTPSGLVGSIGVYTVHDDLSAAYEREGRRRSVIKAGRFKAEAPDSQPLSDEAREYMQGMVDEFYGMFVGAVARNRGVSVAQVRDGYGQGRVVAAKAAKAAGMVDRIATLDETISRLMGTRRHGAASVALERERYELATI